jgi:hypothetical protein
MKITEKNKIEDNKNNFSYIIGSYWPSGGVSAYQYGSTVFNGTPEEAEDMRVFLTGRAKKELKIFKLIEI